VPTALSGLGAPAKMSEMEEANNEVKEAPRDTTLLLAETNGNRSDDYANESDVELEDGDVLGKYTFDHAVEHLGFGRFHWQLLFLCGVGYFAEITELVIVGFVAPAIEKVSRARLSFCARRNPLTSSELILLSPPPAHRTCRCRPWSMACWARPPSLEWQRARFSGDTFRIGSGGRYPSRSQFG